MNPSLKITANSLSTFLADFLKSLVADVENKPGGKQAGQNHHLGQDYPEPK